MRNVEPLPRLDSTQMRPPCISTICLAMASPRPVPPLALVLELSIWWNCSKTRFSSSCRYPWTGVGHGHGEVAVRGRRGDAHLARVGELDGVADEVEKHLGEALLVAKADRQALGDIGLERELLGLRQRLGRRPHRLDHALDRVFAEVQAELTGLDLGDVEHRVDQPQQVLAVGADARERIQSISRTALRRSLPASARRSRGWRRAGSSARGSCWRRTATCAGWRSRARGSSARSR